MGLIKDFVCLSSVKTIEYYDCVLFRYLFDLVGLQKHPNLFAVSTKISIYCLYWQKMPLKPILKELSKDCCEQISIFVKIFQFWQ